jgi:hypothetical protein
MTEIMTKLVFNCSTGEEEIIPLTEQEIAQMNEDLISSKEKSEVEEVKKEKFIALMESAKNKLISGQPLTEDEAFAVLGNINNIELS